MATALDFRSVVFSPVSARPESFASEALLEDRRVSERVPRQFQARLCGFRGPAELTCEIRDISEGGAYVTLPWDCGVGVGQRIEVALEPADGAGDCPTEVCFATVVRTEQLDSGSRSALGVGMRFDQPLFL